MDDLALLRAHEPILRFNRVELFLPADVGAYVGACSLWERQPDGTDLRLADPGELALDSLAHVGRQRAGKTLHLKFVEKPLTRREFRRWRRDGHSARMPHAARFTQVGVTGRLFDALFRVTLLFRGRVPRGSVAAGEITYRTSIAEHGTPYYGRVVREGGWTICQYWFFYPMNDWRSSFHGVNDHEADWEMLTVYLSPAGDGTLAVRWVAFSSHDAEGDALRRRVDDPDLEWRDGHVVAYPGAGSHSHTSRRVDELVRVDPPIMRGATRAARRAIRTITPWHDSGSVDQGLGVPFVDYHRGDGVVVGPGGDREWDPVVIDDDTPWVRDFRGRWGLDTRDRFGGESAPTGPKHERDGIDRVRWEDPLGWAGLQKVDPDPHAPARDVAERRVAIDARIREIDDRFMVQRSAARREAAEARAMDGDSVTHALADERRGGVAERETALQALREERRRLDAERVALAMAEQDGLPTEDARAHLGAGHPAGEDEDPLTHIHQRVLRIWAAISTPLLIGIIIWLLVGNATSYYWLGVLGGIALLVGIESLARGRLLAFLVTVLGVIAMVAIVTGLVQEWRVTLAVLLTLGAIVLLVQNVRELRSG